MTVAVKRCRQAHKQAAPATDLTSISPCQALVGPVGLEPTTRGVTVGAR